MKSLRKHWTRTEYDKAAEYIGIPYQDLEHMVLNGMVREVVVEEIIFPGMPEAPACHTERGLAIPIEEADRIKSLLSSSSTPKLAENQNTINSLLKIIAVMAVDGYGYDVHQERSPIPKQLSEAADSFGVSVSDKTIRKYLKEAVTSHIKQQD